MVTSLVYHKNTIQNTNTTGSIRGVYQKIRKRCYHYVRYLLILISFLIIVVMGGVTIQSIKNLKPNEGMSHVNAINVTHCDCSEILSKLGTGNCESLWRDNESDNVKLWCYIDNPSKCSDQSPSEFHPGRYWSYLGCEQRRIAGECCEDIRHVDCVSCISKRSRKYSCSKEPRLVGCPKQNNHGNEISNTCFQKKEGMHCLVDDSLILPNATLETALTKCASDNICEKVFDDQCDGSGTFLLCGRGTPEFTSDHLSFSEKWAIFMAIYRTKFSNTLEENQILNKSCLYSKSHKNSYCPWK